MLHSGILSRLTRETYKFSKRLNNHVHAQSIFVVYYNFCRPHTGLKGAERHYSPAIKAGLANRVWTLDDILNRVDEYWQKQAVQPVLQLLPSPEFIPLKAGETSSLAYFVMYSPLHRESKTHKGSCRSCRHGLGRTDNASVNKWYAFETRGFASICAKALAPYQNSSCAVCITGHYSRHSVAGKRIKGGPGRRPL